jgi:hypothetical protein
LIERLPELTAGSKVGEINLGDQMLARCEVTSPGAATFTAQEKNK